MCQRLITVVVVLAVGWAVEAGAAPTDAQKCEAAQLTAAGKKLACLANERAKEVKGQTPNYAKCEDAFMEAFEKAEDKAGAGVCPADGMAADIEALVDSSFDALKAALGGTPYSSVPATGQTTCWDPADTSIPIGTIACAGTGQDGAVQAGVPLPSPRFTDNGNGTVTDNLTGLKWLQDANCFATRTWAQALGDANGLASGACGLTDGSVAGAWRLPNVRELQSLIHYGFFDPALSNAAGTAKWTAGDAFSNVQSSGYWSSTTLEVGPDTAWFVDFFFGFVNFGSKTDGHFGFVLPVRGP
jgi:hypothetical protein